jgi:2',3'-cyclic-nucleotide 2'-phosphodiesterase (5'-nucleotidase family)
MKLKILYINDIHSRFEELARIASAIEELCDKNTLILDAGDNADFARLETEGTNGRISSALLNEIEFTARAFGNNEGFAGNENSRIISESSDCPVVTCNMYDLEGQKLDFLDDAMVLQVSGIRVLIVGVTAAMNVFYHLFGIHVKDPQEEVQRVLAKYEETSYDLLVILSHLGITRDRELASKFPNIDIIIGGHSHTMLEKPFVENHSIICQAGHYGEYLGELIVDFNVENKTIRNFTGRLISSQKYPRHHKIMKLIRQYSRQADENLTKKLYSIDTALDHSLTKENAIGNLLADSLKDMLKTEIGIINSGVINKGVKQGAVTKKLLHELSPSPLNPTYIEIRGVDLCNTLEKSLQREYQLKDGRGPGFRGRFLGNIQVSHNIQVRFSAREKFPRRISAVTVDGRPLEPDRWYAVGTSDYLQRGTGYSDLANNRNEKYRPEFLREVLELYLKNKSFVERALNRRFIVEERKNNCLNDGENHRGD